MGRLMPHGRPSGLMHSTSHVCHIHVLESKTTWRSASTGKQTWIKLICSQISPEFAPFINRCCWISTTINHSKSLFNLSPPPKKKSSRDWGTWVQADCEKGQRYETLRHRYNITFTFSWKSKHWSLNSRCWQTNASSICIRFVRQCQILIVNILGS